MEKPEPQRGLGHIHEPERDLRTRLQNQDLRQRFLEKKQARFQRLLEEDREKQIRVQKRSVDQQVQRQLLTEQLRNKPVVTQPAPR